MSLVAYASSDDSESDSEMAAESAGRLFPGLPPPSSRRDFPPPPHTDPAAYPTQYPRQPPGEEPHSPGYYGGYGLSYPMGGYGPPPSYSPAPFRVPGYPGNQGPPGYGSYNHNSQGTGGASYTPGMAFSPQGANPANYPPPTLNLPPHGGSGMNLPPPQGGMGPPPPQGGPGMSHPPPFGSPTMGHPPPHSSQPTSPGGPNTNNSPSSGPPNMSHPPPQGLPNMNHPPPQGPPNMNHPPPQGPPNMSHPPPQGPPNMSHGPPNMSHPPPQGPPNISHPPPQQGGTGIGLPSPHGAAGMNLPPPQGGPGMTAMNFPPPQSGPEMNLPPLQGGLGLHMPPPQGAHGLSLPPPQGSHVLNLPPPQNSSGLKMPAPQGGLGMNLPPPQSSPGTNPGGHTLNLPPPQVTPGLNLPPPMSGQGLNIPPPQQSPTSVGGEPQIPLPPPKASGHGLNLAPLDNDSFGGSKPKKRSEPVKISIPELHTGDSDSEDDEPTKKKSISQASKEGFGLSSLLPQPKNALGGDSKRQLLPYTFTKKNSDTPSDAKPARKTPLSKPKLTPNPEVSHTPSPSAIKAAAKNAALQVTKQITQEEDEESDDEFQQGNFFSLSESNEVPAATAESFTYPLPPALNDDGPPGVDAVENDAANAPLEFKTAAGPNSNQQWSGASTDDYGGQQYSQYPEYNNPTGASYYQDYYSGNYYPESDQPSAPRDSPSSDSFMDDEAFKRLQGKRNRGREEINFLDIKGDDQLSGNQQWLTKALTEEKNMKSFSKKKGEQPTGQQRRKHQITYLIHQAKERELELKNTWSDNKMSRRQTQAKYGF